MKTIFRGGIFLAFIASTFGAGLDTARIDELTGLKGKMNEKEGAYKVSFPRNDVKVVVDGWSSRRSWVLARGRHSPPQKTVPW
ncbi:MAG TPA: hypothetical protein VGM65_05880 [Candidatus Udaeobacter sp.]|jgi:hypothetical protein